MRLLCRRFLLYLSTPSEAPSAAQDLQPALEALVNMRELSNGAAPCSASDGEEQRASDSRPKALLVAYYTRVCSPVIPL